MQPAELERGFLDALFGDWPVGIAILDADRRIVRSNGACTPLCEDGFVDRIAPWLDAIERDGTVPVRHRLDDGDRTLQVSIVPITSADRTKRSGTAIYVVDVTAEVRATDELEHQTAVIYDEIVQSLVAATIARDVGRDELVDEHLRNALEVARRLATKSVDKLLDLEGAGS